MPKNKRTVKQTNKQTNKQTSKTNKQKIYKVITDNAVVKLFGHIVL